MAVEIAIPGDDYVQKNEWHLLFHELQGQSGMYNSVKCLRGIEETTEDSTSVVDVIINCLFQTVKSVYRRAVAFKPKLVLSGCQIILKFDFENMLKEFGCYRRDGDATIVTHICVVALWILDERHDVTTTKLLGHILSRRKKSFGAFT